MGYANYVGRVGALAVALGLGVAIANSAAIALADSSGSSSTGSPSGTSTGSSSSSSSSGTGSSSPKTGPASTDAASSANQTSTNSATQSGSPTDPRAGVVQVSGGADTSTPATGTASTKQTTPTSTPSSEISSASTAPAPDLSMTTSAPEQTAAPSSEGPTNTTPATSSTDASTSTSSTRGRSFAASSPATSVGTADVSAKVADAAPPVTARPKLAAATSSLTTSASPTVIAAAAPAVSAAGFQAKTAAFVTPAAPAVVSAPASPADIITTLVSGLLSVIGLNPQAASGPLAPPQLPTLWTLLAWVRREFEQSFSIGSPTVGPVATASLLQSPDLLVNAGAEFGDPSLSGYSSVTVPGWLATGTPTVIDYGTLRRFPLPLSTPGPTLPAFLGFPTSDSGSPSGQQFFGGGPVATSTLTQTVDLSAAAPQIDTGTVPYRLSADLGGFFIDPSAASVTVAFLGTSQQQLGTGQIAPVTALDRLFQTTLLSRATSGAIPVGTRSAQVVVTFTDRNPVLGNYNNAYADNVSLTVGANLPAPPPPTPPVSTVGSLDHAFLIYLENHGVTDIVGSPNAPYLNSLINTYGYESNYYALTHPSDPNYYPILGGSDFGINYNCPANCFDQPNLADNIEAAGKTWAGYEQNGGGYSSPTDQLPFLTFSDIYNDPARVQAHLFPLTELAPDLQSPATAPNFAWIAADEANNGEGPISLPFGALQFVLSELTTHQYNVAAADQFLQDTLPTIMNSPVWQDPTQKSAIFLTFDEDYNNLSLGIGNQGNHIPMIVIPSPGTVAAGMRAGQFVAVDPSNHYSLQRTIEDALGLPPLTNNDKFAQPLNEFWT